MRFHASTIGMMWTAFGNFWWQDHPQQKHLKFQKLRAYQHEKTVQTKEPLVELIFPWTRHNHGIMVPWIPCQPVKLLEQTLFHWTISLGSVNWQLWPVSYLGNLENNIFLQKVSNVNHNSWKFIVNSTWKNIFVFLLPTYFPIKYVIPKRLKVGHWLAFSSIVHAHLSEPSQTNRPVTHQCTQGELITSKAWCVWKKNMCNTLKLSWES